MLDQTIPTRQHPRWLVCLGSSDKKRVSTALRAWRGLGERHSTDDWTRAITKRAKQLASPWDRLAAWSEGSLKLYGVEGARTIEEGAFEEWIPPSPPSFPKRHPQEAGTPFLRRATRPLFRPHSSIQADMCAQPSSNQSLPSPTSALNHYSYSTNATVGFSSAQSNAYSPSPSSTTPADSSPPVENSSNVEQPHPTM